MFTKLLYLIDRVIVSRLPRISPSVSTTMCTTIPTLMRALQRPTIVIVVALLYRSFTSITSSRSEKSSVVVLPSISAVFIPTARHVPSVLARVIIERIVGAVIRIIMVIRVVVAGVNALAGGVKVRLYTSSCRASTVGVRDGHCVCGAAVMMVVHGLGDLRDRMQTVQTLARIASHAMCWMYGTRGWHVLIAWPANGCAEIIGT